MVVPQSSSTNSKQLIHAPASDPTLKAAQSEDLRMPTVSPLALDPDYQRGKSPLANYMAMNDRSKSVQQPAHEAMQGEEPNVDVDMREDNPTQGYERAWDWPLKLMTNQNIKKHPTAWLRAAQRPRGRNILQLVNTRYLKLETTLMIILEKRHRKRDRDRLRLPRF